MENKEAIDTLRNHFVQCTSIRGDRPPRSAGRRRIWVHDVGGGAFGSWLVGAPRRRLTAPIAPIDRAD